MKLDAMSRQGFRSDLTSDQVGRKLETADIIAQQSDDSKTQVRRYIRLTNLIPELLEFMDEGKMALSVGVELSYLDDQLQYDVLEQCEQNDCTPSYSQAFRMHKADREGLLTKAVIQNIMCEEKPTKKKRSKFLPSACEPFFPKAWTHKRRKISLYGLANITVSIFATVTEIRDRRCAYEFKMNAVIHLGNNYNNALRSFQHKRMEFLEQEIRALDSETAVVTLTPALQKRPHIGKRHRLAV